MPAPIGRDVVHRAPANPLIIIEDLPFQASDVHNAGVVRDHAGYTLLVTIESLEGQCSIYRADSRDGRSFAVEPEPFMQPCPDPPFRDCECVGVRDARITRLDDTCYVAYLAECEHGHRVGLARTDDFRSVQRLGFVTEPDTKNGALFPERIRGRYAMLIRPDNPYSIWIVYSDDLVYWGDANVLMMPRSGYWDSHRIGAGPPPIPIDEGWLLIYYGERATTAGPLFRLGAAILDREDPSKIVARSNIPILAPRETYERIGDVPNLLFCCGALLEDDDTLRIYYGGSDSCICLGTAPLHHVIEVCREGDKEIQP